MQRERRVAVAADGVFLVVVHDVAPRFLGQISSILDEIRPQVGNQVVAGVVPRWHGERPRDGAFAREVRARFGEIALHGLTHKQRRPSGVVSALTGMSNEFGGLDFTGALARVVEGYDTIAEMFGEAPRGFIPPAWDRGPASMRLLRACGLSYCAGMTALEGAGGERTPLSTWSWDSGRLAELGHLGHLMGHVMFAVRPRSHKVSIPVSCHPNQPRRRSCNLGRCR